MRGFEVTAADKVCFGARVTMASHHERRVATVRAMKRPAPEVQRSETGNRVSTSISSSDVGYASRIRGAGRLYPQVPGRKPGEAYLLPFRNAATPVVGRRPLRLPGANIGTGDCVAMSVSQFPSRTRRGIPRARRSRRALAVAARHN